MGAYRAVVAAVVAFAATAVVTVIVLGIPYFIGLAAAIVMMVAAWLIVSALFPYDAALEGYKLDALRRVRNLQRQLSQIKDSSAKIRSTTVRENLERGCALIHEVLKLTQQKDRNSVASVAAGLAPYLSSVLGIQATYLEFQKDPDMPNRAAYMQRCEEAFESFKAIAVQNKAKALSGDLMQLMVDIKRLEPLAQPNLEGLS